ncbi:MAG: hypothetical protein ACHQ1E_05045 [Ktedonobacterales bacterium]|jgi:hypothetical protein
MNLSRDEAQAALDDIHQATARTYPLLRAWLYSVLVIGIVWTIAFGLAQWNVLSPIWSAGETILVGVVCSFLFAQWLTPVVRFTPGSRSAFLHTRLPIFYAVLYAFFILWQFMLDLPQAQLAMLWITVVMLATITTGILLQQRLFIIVGVAITVMASIGYWAIPQYFWLWVAIFAGLPLIGVSLYLLRRR